MVDVLLEGGEPVISKMNINFKIVIIDIAKNTFINIINNMNKINIYCSKEANLPRHSLQSTGSAIAVEA